MHHGVGQETSLRDQPDILHQVQEGVREEVLTDEVTSLLIAWRTMPKPTCLHPETVGDTPVVAHQVNDEDATTCRVQQLRDEQDGSAGRAVLHAQEHRPISLPEASP